MSLSPVKQLRHLKGGSGMSKGDSHLFPNTSGAGRSLIDEVIANGEKISPDEVLLITEDP